VSYDSTEDTKAHIMVVQDLMEEMIGDLRYRSALHDSSKLEDPEKAMFDEFTPRLRALEYGTDEYKQTLQDMGPALAHHYAKNAHHPEHFEDGIQGMSLLDLIEMLADWKAAGKRHADGGDIRRSIAVNQERFGYSEELRALLENTVRELGW
jgi:hypothetical protein